MSKTSPILVALSLFSMMALQGCRTQIESKAYRLIEAKAESALINSIVTDEQSKLRDGELIDLTKEYGGKLSVINTVDGVAVVRTTPIGHRRIQLALEDLRSQPSATD